MEQENNVRPTQMYLGIKVLKDAYPMRAALAQATGYKVGSENSEFDPEAQGYEVTYEDGYMSWSPKAVFEAAYRPVDGLTFGLAVEAMKLGKKVARMGWNGANMFAYYVKGQFEGDMVPYRPYLALKTAQNDIATWNPSTSDCLAEDWFIV